MVNYFIWENVIKINKQVGKLIVITIIITIIIIIIKINKIFYV